MGALWNRIFSPGRAPVGRKESQVVAEPSSPAPAPLKGNGTKVLIVDDDPVILKTTSQKLAGEGYTVLTAVDASGAITAVRTEKPRLVLLDINFPPDVAHGGSVAWDAFLIMSWLRRIDEGKNVPIIVITGGTSAKYRSQALSAGAADFFTKPIDHAALFTAIARALSETVDSACCEPACAAEV